MATYNVLDLRQLRMMFPQASVVFLGDDFFIADYSYSGGEDIPFDNSPVRINGYIGFFCVSGDLTFSVDFRESHIRGNTFSVITPMNIIRINRNPRKKPSRIIAVGLSANFMSRMNYDLDELFREASSPLSLPTISLKREEILLAEKYYSLVKLVLQSRRPFVAESIMALCSSLLFEVAGSWRSRNKVEDENIDFVSHSRTKVLYDRFIKLVAKYHITNRTVQFYADKLYISPKYLSKVIKTCSGQTPSYWIDSYTILEAQNLLRYSNYTVKQIVFKLNFSNQSVFQKFFKAQTGITPLQYRKGKG